MERKGVQRRLIAILYADVAGYCRLTGSDEEGTHRSLSTSLDFITSAVKGRGGRVIHYAGDAVLAEFSSVFVAIECAVELQRELAKRNLDVEAERRLLYRIGINLGDVIVDRDDIYGDSVNVAARLESLAEPGGICVSAKVREEIGNKHDLTFVDMGEQKVKNIAEPIRTYRVRMDFDAIGTEAEAPSSILWRWAAPATILVLLAITAIFFWFKPWTPSNQIASEANMAFPLPDKPSIAVLPFDNLSDDPQQAYFADGITEDIITTLSRMPFLFVIARNSTFVYKGRPVRVQQVAEELGVRYVLEGSVQRAGGKVRITAQLIDALSGNHLWAERYDRELKDLFALQDEITHEIAIALQVKLTLGEQVHVWRKSVTSIESWNFIAQGMEQMYHFVKAKNARARELFEKAVKAEPMSAMAHALIGWTHWMDAQNGWSESKEKSIEHSFNQAKKAYALNDSSPDVHALMGAIALIRRDYETAIAEAEKAVSLNTNHATNTALLGMILHNSARAEEAISRLKTAMRLSPYYPNWYLSNLAWAYMGAGQFELAINAFMRYKDREPEPTHKASAYIGMALALDNLGHEEEARSEVVKAAAVFPKISATHFIDGSLHIDQAALEASASTLRRLGLPE